jgi:hypothetical protein
MRRVVLGQQADGSVGLRCSSAGFDAFTAADDGLAITFDSRWTDIVRPYQAGILSITSIVVYPTGTGALPGFQANWVALGYKPFIEARYYNGVVYDDYWNAGKTSGCYAGIWDGFFQIPSGVSDPGFFLYVVYPIPVPTQ